MTEQHPISPPQELVRQWAKQRKFLSDEIVFATIAQWGADQELEACCEWNSKQEWTWTSAQLRAARRPKPPSAIEQAESLIESHEDGWVPNPAQWHVIREGLAEGRRALEALPDD